MLAPDCPHFRLNDPFTVISLSDVSGTAAADDFDPFHPRPGGECLRHPRRIGVTIIRCMQAAKDTIKIVKRVLFSDLFGTNEFHGESKSCPDAHRMAQPVHLIIGIGQPERPAAMPCHRDACFFFQLPGIEIDIVTDAFAQPVGRR